MKRSNSKGKSPSATSSAKKQNEKRPSQQQQLTRPMKNYYFQRMTQLSLENNFIDSLDGFELLENLVELYLSNNLLEELRAVLTLKNCARLRVLDLSGNPLCSGASSSGENNAGGGGGQDDDFSDNETIGG
ncbi:unnamed protein product, partial [Amoebophrya sp. A120]|eukprot:GSA120T00019271001.1